MPLFGSFVGDLYRRDRKRFIASVLLTVANGLMGGAGLLLIVPLLSVAGLTPSSGGFMGILGGLFGNFSPAIRLIFVLLIYTCLVVLQTLAGRASAIVDSAVTNGYTAYLRTQFFGRSAHAEWEYMLTRKKSDFTNALTVEIGRISSGAVFFLRLIAQVTVAVIQLGIALLVSTKVTLAVVAAGALFFLYTNSSAKRARKLGQDLLKFNRELQGSIGGQFGAFKEVKIYGIEAGQTEAFSGLCERLRDNLVDFARLQSRPDFVYKTGAAVLVSLFMFFSIEVAGLAAPALIMMIYIFARLWPLFSGFQVAVQQISAMLPSFAAYSAQMAEFDAHAERGAGGTDREDDVGGARGGGSGTAAGRESLPLSDAIECHGVTFAYSGAGAFALRDIDLRIPAKTMTALVGRSGAGKSTLADLLTGLLLPQEGKVLVDGRDIGEGERYRWRSCIGYVPQDPFLLDGSIRENLLRFNPGADQTRVEESLTKASADFVFALPKGLDTVVGDRGVMLSGGERQRIVLARALLRNPEFLVLDEATSALDNENEYRIQKAVAELEGQVTVLVIAHRLSTIKRASRIVVLDGGRIVETGAYDSLTAQPRGWLRKMLDYGELA
ncbi:MAG TPA: ABC transporter ATP-binding protein [Rectinemataceae bacterium]|nr:ABC transporter ATP-binding protein [Rectinemataceae bacterium]